jgi:hypothetical protein
MEILHIGMVKRWKMYAKNDGTNGEKVEKVSATKSIPTYNYW